MPAHPDLLSNSWQNLYQLACSETDVTKVAYRVGQAEMAIFRRAREIGHERNEAAERQAMNRASHELLRIRIKALGGDPVDQATNEKTARNRDEEREEGINREIRVSERESVEIKAAHEMEKPVRNSSGK